MAVKRALPWPSTLNSVVWGAWYTSAVARRLPRSAFEPPPAVDAGVLVFQRRASSLVSEPDSHAYRGFVATGFRHGLRAVVPSRTLRRNRLAGRAPRELDAHEWAALRASVTSY